MQFIDEVRIHCRSGKGGDGIVHFRREAKVPKGGPDGGDGGRGGSVILEADPKRNTLMDLRFNPHQRAENGRPGGSQTANGRSGRDRIVKVPLGTMAWNEDGELLADLDSPHARFNVAQGGRGGKGNAHFKSSTNRTPTRAIPGGPAIEETIRLELRLLADVGLLGFPNAGKSTLISRISAAKPQIADYPFTTLTPKLGVVRGSEYRSIVVADIPGLIEGAADGRGLGNRFLRHVERTRVLCHMLSVAEDEAEPDPLIRYRQLREELRIRAEAEQSDLDQRPEIVVLSKIDTRPPEEIQAIVERFAEENIKLITISAVTGSGLDELVEMMFAHALHPRIAADEPAP